MMKQSTIKITSNKDGESRGKWETYASYMPCSYTVTLNDDKVGTISRDSIHPGNLTDPIWKYEGAKQLMLAWIFSGNGIRLISQNLADLRSLIKKQFSTS